MANIAKITEFAVESGFDFTLNYRTNYTELSLLVAKNCRVELLYDSEYFGAYMFNPKGDNGGLYYDKLTLEEAKECCRRLIKYGPDFQSIISRRAELHALYTSTPRKSLREAIDVKMSELGAELEQLRVYLDHG